MPQLAVRRALVIVAGLILVGCTTTTGGQSALAPEVETGPAAAGPTIETHTQQGTTFDIYGVLTLYDGRLSSNEALTAFSVSGIGCSGRGNFGDIVEHASVTIYDGQDNAVAVGLLGAGVIYPTDGTVQCKVGFGVDNVPFGSSVYKIEITNRGKVAVSAANAQQTVLMDLNR